MQFSEVIGFYENDLKYEWVAYRKIERLVQPLTCIACITLSSNFPTVKRVGSIYFLCLIFERITE